MESFAWQLFYGLSVNKCGNLQYSSDTPHYQQNVPFEVPSNWTWTILGEIFTLQAGKNITAKDISAKQDTDHRYPCYGGNGLRGYVSNYNKEGHFPLIGRQGALCGNVNEANGKFYATEHAVVVDTYCRTNIPWAINTLLYLNLNQYATSTAQPGLSVSTINDVMIPIPPLEEQQRIVAEVNHWFALIDQIEQRKADLQTTIKQAKSKILDLAIHGKLVPQDANDEPASELLKRINPKAEITCDNGHYPQLPIGWAVVPMQMLCSLVDGEKVDGKEMPNLDVKYLRGEREFKILKSGKYVATNSLLILVDGENSGEVFRTPIEGYQGSTFKQLHINENMCANYLLYVINLHLKALRENKVGSAIPHLDKKLFKTIEVPVPPYNEQVRIVTAINAVLNRFDAIMENL